MPLIDPMQFPKFDAALKEAGLISKDRDSSPLQEDLDRVGLGKLDVLNTVGDIMRTGETSQNRLKAAEIGLKLNGLLSRDDNAIQVPHVTIVIKDSQHTDINPILIPR